MALSVPWRQGDLALIIFLLRVMRSTEGREISEGREGESDSTLQDNRLFICFLFRMATHLVSTKKPSNVFCSIKPLYWMACSNSHIALQLGLQGFLPPCHDNAPSFSHLREWENNQGTHHWACFSSTSNLQVLEQLRQGQTLTPLPPPHATTSSVPGYKGVFSDHQSLPVKPLFFFQKTMFLSASLYHYQNCCIRYIILLMFDWIYLIFDLILS